MKVPQDTNAIVALLDGQLDRLAVKLICEGGVFSLHKEQGVPDAIFEASGESFHAFEEAKKTIALTPEQDTALADAVFAGVQQREEVAYLLGVAVGRRLGQMPLSGAACKKGGGR